MPMENQDDLGIDIHQIEQIFVDEYERQKDNSKCVQQIIKRRPQKPIGRRQYITVHILRF